MRNRICFPMVILFLCSAAASARAQDNRLAGLELTEVNNTLLPFLEALQSGDVQTIKSALSEETYKEYKVLLEDNTQYGDFLRSFYRGVRLSVDEVVRTKAEGTVKRVSAKIRFTFPDGSVSTQEVSLNRMDDGVIWKVARLADKKNPKTGN